MRIDDMVRSALGGPLPVPAAVRKARADALAGQSSNNTDDGSGAGKNYLGGTDTGYNAATFVDTTFGKAAAQDSAEFSPEALSGGNTQPGTSDPSNAGSGDIQPLVNENGDVVAAIVDQYIRQRAVMAYTVPFGRGTLSLTYEVESAYRVTQLVLPGSNLNVTA
ncbi:MAG: hypothetical protein ACREJO_05240 [Phycisphaerales bacterium]